MVINNMYLILNVLEDEAIKCDRCSGLIEEQYLEAGTPRYCLGCAKQLGLY